jgi:hypothetical protein
VTGPTRRARSAVSTQCPQGPCGRLEDRGAIVTGVRAQHDADPTPSDEPRQPLLVVAQWHVPKVLAVEYRVHTGGAQQHLSRDLSERCEAHVRLRQPLGTDPRRRGQERQGVALECDAALVLAVGSHVRRSRHVPRQRGAGSGGPMPSVDSGLGPLRPISWTALEIMARQIVKRLCQQPPQSWPDGGSESADLHNARSDPRFRRRRRKESPRFRSGAFAASPAALGYLGGPRTHRMGRSLFPIKVRR